MSDAIAARWTEARQARLSMGLPRQEYWSGLPFPSPGDLPDPEIEPRSPALQADHLPGKPLFRLSSLKTVLDNTYNIHKLKNSKKLIMLF